MSDDIFNSQGDLPTRFTDDDGTFHNQGDNETRFASGDSGTLLPQDGIIAGRFKVVGVIDAGFMGQIYKVEDQNDGNEIKALKILLPSLMETEQRQERFSSETLIARGLDHPNIIKTIDTGEHEGLYYIVLEYLEGRSLAQILAKRGTLTLEHTQGIILRLLDALSYAHQTTIHGDIKPQNIFMCNDGVVKLLDFGIARLVGSQHHAEHTNVAGTVNYMAPEQLERSKVTASSDLYAIGIVMYECLVGHLPLGRFKLPGELKTGIPQSIDVALERLLEPDPVDRYQRAAEVTKALVNPPGPDIQKTEKLKIRTEQPVLYDTSKNEETDEEKQKKDDLIREAHQRMEELRLDPNPTHVGTIKTNLPPMASSSNSILGRLVALIIVIPVLLIVYFGAIYWRDRVPSDSNQEQGQIASQPGSELPSRDIARANALRYRYGITPTRRRLGEADIVEADAAWVAAESASDDSIAVTEYMRAEQLYHTIINPDFESVDLSNDGALRTDYLTGFWSWYPVISTPQYVAALDANDPDAIDWEDIKPLGIGKGCHLQVTYGGYEYLNARKIYDDDGNLINMVRTYWQGDLRFEDRQLIGTFPTNNVTYKLFVNDSSTIIFGRIAPDFSGKSGGATSSFIAFYRES